MGGVWLVWVGGSEGYRPTSPLVIPPCPTRQAHLSSGDKVACLEVAQIMSPPLPPEHLFYLCAWGEECPTAMNTPSDKAAGGTN